MTTLSGDKNAAFERKVAAWVQAAVDGGVEDFEALLERLPGVYPTVVRRAVHALVNRNLLKPELAICLMRPSLNTTRRSGDRSVLPLPHPLNYEWRFTPQTSNLLLNLADCYARPGGTVLLFGTPAVAVAGLAKASERHLVFFGEDNPVTRQVSALNKAIGSPLVIENCNVKAPGQDRASVVVLDPPWYLDFIRPMLATAADSCAIGGHVLISLPPEGARPSAAQDRNRVLALAGRLGLAHVETRHLALRYETPFFEANALAVCGMIVSTTWRRGDLFVFRKVGRSDRPIVTTTLRKKLWDEVCVGRMRLFVRRDRPSEGGGLLGPLVQGDVLATVSRRDGRRQAARVWTSGNRIFSSTAPETVIAAALAIPGAQFGAGAQPKLRGTMKERGELDRVGYLLSDLAALEASEEARLSAVRMDWRQVWSWTSTISEGVLAAINFG